jgi:hypothetical protein
VSAARRRFRPPMVDDPPPEVSVSVERELEISPGPAPPGTTQAEWEAYCRDAVLAWRERAFLPVDMPKP